MSSDLVVIFLLSLYAMVTPAIVAAVTVMLLLPNPKRLMFGYLLGAYLTSITAGLLIVSTLHKSGAESTSRHAIGPTEDIVLGVISLAIAWVLRTHRDQPLEERRRRRKEEKIRAKEAAGKPTQALPLRLLGKGDPRVTLVVGAALSFPGVAYLVALDHMHKLDPGPVATVLLVVYFCVMQLMFLEVPLLGFLFAPERTRETVNRFKAWMGRSGRTAAVILATVVGVLLTARGVITLV